MLRINVKLIYERSWLQNLFLVFLGVLLIGTGTALNFCAGLGNDPVSVLFDGVRNKLSVSLGTAAYVINGLVFFITLIFGRKHIGPGTLVYIFLTGKVEDVVVSLYRSFFPSQTLLVSFISSASGSFVMLLGAALMVVSGLGADVWTASAMAFSELMKLDFKKVKVLFDGALCLLGFAFGGTVGIITLLLALFGGPFVKGVSKKMEKILL